MPPGHSPFAIDEARADVLVSGDRTHFGDLCGRAVRGLRVEPPRVALRLVLDGAP